MISNSKMEDELVYCSKCNTQVLQDNLKSHEEGCKQTRHLPVVGKCSYCQKPYKRKKALEDHEIKCKKETIPKEKKKYKKPRRIGIDAGLRIKVWEKYVGQKTRSKCFCCHSMQITPFTRCSTFQAGHIISHANGGKASIDNLLPICRDCNENMSAVNWDDYIAMHPDLPYRIFGANPPAKVIWATTIIQSLVRMWIERNNPDSYWRVRWRELFHN